MIQVYEVRTYMGTFHVNATRETMWELHDEFQRLTRGRGEAYRKFTFAPISVMTVGQFRASLVEQAARVNAGAASQNALNTLPT
jgi:hypothetical protein